ELLRHSFENMDDGFVLTTWKQIVKLKEAATIVHMSYAMESLQLQMDDMAAKEDEKMVARTFAGALEVMNFALQQKVMPGGPVLSSLFIIAVAAGHPELVIKVAQVFPNVPSDLISKYISQLASAGYEAEANYLQEVLTSKSPIYDP